MSIWLPQENDKEGEQNFVQFSIETHHNTDEGWGFSNMKIP